MRCSILFLLLLPLHVDAQSIFVQMTDGMVISYEIAHIRSTGFNDEHMTVSTLQGMNYSWPLAEIDHVRFNDLSTSMAEDQVHHLVSAYDLYPNPTRGDLQIAFTVRGPSPVRVEIFDMASRSVRVVQDGTMASGRQEITWDGRDGIGNRVGSGAYLCVFSQGLLRATKTLLLEHQ
jgi:hypothetical protein